MARSVDKKKPSSSLFDYDDKNQNYYDSSMIRNEVIHNNFPNQPNLTYFYNSNKNESKKRTKGINRIVNKRPTEASQNVYCANDSPFQQRSSGIYKKSK